MKKSLCIILSVMMLLVSLAACNKNAENKSDVTTTTTTTTEAAFNNSIIVDKTQAVTDAQGNAVTDAQGNTVTEKVTDANGNVVTETIKPTLPSVTNPDPFANGSAAANTSLVNDVLKPIFNGKKFTMVCATVVDGSSIPMTVVVDGNNMAIFTSMKEVMNASGMEMSKEEAAMMKQMMGDEIRVVVKDGKSYSLMELFGKKVYMEENALGMDTSGFTDIVATDMTYVKTTTVKNGDKTYTCEEYKSKDGVIRKYYFLGNQLVRMETIEGKAPATVIEVTSLSTNVNKSYFSTAGYTKFDESSLGSMMGGMQ